MKGWSIFCIVFLVLLSNLYSQSNTTCQNAAPFCTGTTYNFPAGVNAGSAQNGPYYDCLFTQPNPVWYYMQVAQSGPIQIVMNGSGNQDIDFCCWGPFPNLNNVCNNLTAANVVDCSYSTASTETCTIPNAIAGQFYILLITNFSNQPQNIIFNQGNANQPGAGSTNCGILCSMTVTGTSSLCAGQSATLSAVGGTSVQSINWIGPNNYSSANNPTPTIPNMQSSGVYTAIATMSGTNPATNTCSLTHSITVNPVPVVTASNGGPYCAGLNAQLNAGGASTYTWTGPGGFTSTQQNPLINGASSSASGIYTVVAASAVGCTAQTTTQLQINNNPTVQVSSSGNFCEGQSFQLSASGASSYTWTGPNNFNVTGATASFQNNNLNMSGSYTVLGATNNCTNINTIQITINPTPQIQLSSNAPVCEGFSLVLQSSGAQNYLWTGPNNYSGNGNNILFNPAQPFLSGTYSVLASSVDGCTAQATIPVTVHPVPLLSVQADDRCKGDNITFSVSGADPAGTFNWSGPDGFQSNQQNPSIVNAQPQQTGIYTITYTSPVGCTGSASVHVDVYPLPNIQISGTPEACYGDKITLTGSGALYYKWLAPWGTVGQGPQLVIATSSSTYTSVYTLVGMDINGCTSTVNITTIVHPLPQANIIPSKSGDCVPYCSQLTFQNAPQNITQFDWSFSNGSTISQQNPVEFCIQNPGTYTATLFLKDSHGCRGIVTKSLEGYPVPNADFTFEPGNPTFLTPEVQFYDQTTGAQIVKWLWDFQSNNQFLDTVQHPLFNFKDMGVYLTSLYVTSDKGCQDTIFKKVIIGEDFGLYIPNAFSPNGDGLNDTFMPKGHGIHKWEIFIYDRWGNIIYHSKEFGKGWDGSINGSGQATNDVYTYLIKVKDLNGKVKEFKGHVTLLR